jgi:hypothetical protein
MPEFSVIGHSISIAAIRDYIFTHKIDKGDTIVLNPMDYEHVTEEIKHSGEPIDIPLNVLGILISKDTAGTVPVGKVQLIKDDTM